MTAGTRLDVREVHDFWPRVLASPILGALIVNVFGLIDHTRHSPGALAASYAWFTVVALLVWEGNRRLYFRVQRREDWLQHPWWRLSLLLAIIVLYTIPVTAILLAVWRAITVVENDLRLGPPSPPSTGIGLTNLAERFRIATARPIEWRSESGRFVVRLPLLRGANS